jgi:hypothetical protein
MDDIDQMDPTVFAGDFDDDDTLEAAQPAELESFLATARAAHEERIREFWLKLSLDWDA